MSETDQLIDSATELDVASRAVRIVLDWVGDSAGDIARALKEDETSPEEAKGRLVSLGLMADDMLWKFVDVVKRLGNPKP